MSGPIRSHSRAGDSTATPAARPEEEVATVPVVPRTDGAGLYLDLMKQCLTRSIFPAYSRVPAVPEEIAAWLEVMDYDVIQQVELDHEARELGMDWPVDAETMIGPRRLESLESCVVDVLERGVPGDFIETGVWRGGASIFMRAILARVRRSRATGLGGRLLPGAPRGRARTRAAPAGRPPLDGLAPRREPRDGAGELRALRTPRRPGALPPRAGSRRPCPTPRSVSSRSPASTVTSTSRRWTRSSALYPKLSVGGYLIVDDLSIAQCQQAVNDYRVARGIDEPIVQVDWTCGYWKKSWPAPA